MCGGENPHEMELVIRILDGQMVASWASLLASPGLFIHLAWSSQQHGDLWEYTLFMAASFSQITWSTTPKKKLHCFFWSNHGSHTVLVLQYLIGQSNLRAAQFQGFGGIDFISSWQKFLLVKGWKRPKVSISETIYHIFLSTAWFEWKRMLLFSIHQLPVRDADQMQ